MGRQMLAIVPTPPVAVALERFQPEATERPLYRIVQWSTGGPAPRRRQLAIESAGGDPRLLELQRLGGVKDSNRSWFVGGRVQQDGSVVVFSQMDPLFVLLHALHGQRDKYLSTYDHLARDGNTWWLELASTMSQAKIERIGDVQYTGDEAIDNLYVRFNEAKTIQWLASKVRRLAEVLAKHAAAASKSGAAFDARFVLPGQSAAPSQSATDQLDPTRYHKDAIDLILDYVPMELLGPLYNEFQVSKNAPSSASAKAIGGVNVAEPADSIRRFDRRLQPENATPAKRASNTAAANNSNSAKKKSKLANVDRSGMKSISSFFGKK